MKVALGQTIGTPGNIAANLTLMQNLAMDAAERGADLLLLPELFLSGYNIGTLTHNLAEIADGPSAKAAGEIARNAGIAISYGYPERSAGGVYNAALIIDREGKTIANYRKTHLWGAEERALFLPGRDTVSFHLGGLYFGFMICYDIDFPEMARSFALDGVDAILAISATTKPYHAVSRHLIPARAYENRLFFIFANRTGEEHGLAYTGESCITAPDGAMLVECGEKEELAVGKIDTAAYTRFRNEHRFLADRRPDLYRA
ncbi:carbon-nitrogen hydrolase family protein [Dongia soli]|uniref:Carbon-nitrogen hydrolase family protein n=1 Tax=Dongia soli TaxID=600628 RepID=A0ABU5EE05_9PROT|nr:carbon-nitrogen hydrolase family protein [Dongia soli]MDY0884397.1 carbon-nitrogen hydrolase family protein [Dongia soli]